MPSGNDAEIPGRQADVDTLPAGWESLTFPLIVVDAVDNTGSLHLSLKARRMSLSGHLVSMFSVRRGAASERDRERRSPLKWYVFDLDSWNVSTRLPGLWRTRSPLSKYLSSVASGRRSLSRTGY